MDQPPETLEDLEARMAAINLGITGLDEKVSQNEDELVALVFERTELAERIARLRGENVDKKLPGFFH